MKIGYGRVSSDKQSHARQIEYFSSVGVEKIYLDTITGVATRPQLEELKSYIREGDTLYISELARLGRSTRDLLDLIDFFIGKGVVIVSAKEQIDTSTPQGRFITTIWAGMSQLDREYIKQKQAEGIAVAKKEHKYKGRKPISVDMTKMRAECAKWRAGEQTAVKTAERMGLKKNTFYKIVKENGL